MTCSLNCIERPDAVNKKNWKCLECGTDLKKAHEERQRKSVDYYNNIAQQERAAIIAATTAYNKVFADNMKVKTI